MNIGNDDATASRWSPTTSAPDDLAAGQVPPPSAQRVAPVT
jgi:hypothetical protein